MIFGIGTDIVSIQRIERIYAKFGIKFVDHILTEQEKELFEKRKNKTNFLASRFAAKEAFAKALGTGMTGGLYFNKIGTHSDKLNKPIMHVDNDVKKTLSKKNVTNISVTLSDDRDYAVAFVVLET